MGSCSFCNTNHDTFFSLMKENFFNESNHYYSALQRSFASNWFLTILPSNLSFLGSFIQR